jgi:hypothetical protein
VAYTREWMCSKSSDLFCNARAHLAIKLVMESNELGGGLRYVASMMLRGINGCVPVMIVFEGLARLQSQPLLAATTTTTAGDGLVTSCCSVVTGSNQLQSLLCTIICK